MVDTSTIRSALFVLVFYMVALFNVFRQGWFSYHKVYTCHKAWLSSVCWIVYFYKVSSQTPWNFSKTPRGSVPISRVKSVMLFQGHQSYWIMSYISLDQWRVFCSSFKLSHIVNHYDYPNFWVCYTLLRNLLIIYPIFLQSTDENYWGVFPFRDSLIFNGLLFLLTHLLLLYKGVEIKIEIIK